MPHTSQKVLSGYDVSYARTFKNARWARVHATVYPSVGNYGITNIRAEYRRTPELQYLQKLRNKSFLKLLT